MIRIVFICSLISIARSEECSLNATELNRLQRSFSEASAYMQNQDKSNAVVCIGAARAGKSTLINYLMGNKLNAVRPTRTSKMIIELADNTTAGPEIGPGTLSKTTMPSKWNSNLLPGLAIWDSPGFGDNRGPVTDITNAFFLYQLLKNVDSLKIALVINFQDITGDNIQQFLSLLRSLENFFGDFFKHYFSSIAIIFSKAPYIEDDITVDGQYISEKLKDQVLNTNIPDMSETSKDFVKYITENKDHIGFFRRVTKTGAINSEIDDNIISAIEVSTFINKEYISDLHPSISQTSKLCLHSARKKLLSIPKLGELQTFVTNLLNRKAELLNSMDMNSDSNELKTIQTDLIRIRTLLRKFDIASLNANEGIEELKSIDSSVKNKIENDNLVKDMNLIAFVDMLLQSGVNEELKLLVKTIYNTALALIENAITVALFKAGDINRAQLNKKINDVQEKYEADLAQLRKELEVERAKNAGGSLQFLVQPIASAIERGAIEVINFFKKLG